MGDCGESDTTSLHDVDAWVKNSSNNIKPMGVRNKALVALSDDGEASQGTKREIPDSLAASRQRAANKPNDNLHMQFATMNDNDIPTHIRLVGVTSVYEGEQIKRASVYHSPLNGSLIVCQACIACWDAHVTEDPTTHDGPEDWLTADVGAPRVGA